MRKSRKKGRVLAFIDWEIDHGKFVIKNFKIGEIDGEAKLLAPSYLAGKTWIPLVEFRGAEGQALKGKLLRETGTLYREMTKTNFKENLYLQGSFDDEEPSSEIHEAETEGVQDDVGISMKEFLSAGKPTATPAVSAPGSSADGNEALGGYAEEEGMSDKELEELSAE